MANDYRRALIQKYFPKNEWERAYRVMMGESGGRSDAVGDDYPIRGVHAPSVGLFQIRTLPGRPSSQQLKNPEFNVKYAANMQRAQGWNPWTVAKKLGYANGTSRVGSAMRKADTKWETIQQKIIEGARQRNYSPQKLEEVLEMGALLYARKYGKTEVLREEGGTAGALQAEEIEEAKPDLPFADEPTETAPERARVGALKSLRKDVENWENFENLVRRYGDVLERYEIRDEYNRFHKEKDRWGKAKESAKKVKGWLKPSITGDYTGKEEE